MIKKKFILSLLVSFAFACLHAQVIDATGAGGAYAIASYPGNFTGYYNGFSVMFRANHNSPGVSIITGANAACKKITIQSTTGARLNINSSGGWKLNITP